MKLFMKIVFFWFAVNGSLLITNSGFIYPYGGVQTGVNFGTVEGTFNSTDLAGAYTQGEEYPYGDQDWTIGSMWDLLAGMFTGFPMLLAELGLPPTLALVIRGMWGVSWVFTLYYLVTGRG